MLALEVGPQGWAVYYNFTIKDRSSLSFLHAMFMDFIVLLPRRAIDADIRLETSPSTRYTTRQQCCLCLFDGASMNTPAGLARKVKHCLGKAGSPDEPRQKKQTNIFPFPAPVRPTRRFAFSSLLPLLILVDARSGFDSRFFLFALAPRLPSLLWRGCADVRRRTGERGNCWLFHFPLLERCLMAAWRRFSRNKDCFLRVW